jgi:thiamine biosynthesis protein ThiI
MFDALIIHTNELVLKGNNRSRFEKTLVDRLAARFKSVAALRLARRDGSVLLFEADEPLTEAQGAALGEVAARTFGVASFLLARRCDRELPDLQRTATELMSGVTGTFKVEASRRDKTYPVQSQEICRELGGWLLENLPGLSVTMRSPQTIVHVEVDYTSAYVAVAKQTGPGGLPTGTAGKVTALLSGGIDSPVAAWRLMRRGCEVVMVHCHSYPHVGRESVVKAERLAERLAAWQGQTRLWLVPLADAQREIAAKCADGYRVILYRRLMLRVAERLTVPEGSLGLVTGDAVGQVASQTLNNLAVVSAATTLPIYRPLIGDDKDEIVAVARRLGTYAISIERHDDCCSLFMPRNPITNGRLTEVEAEEAKVDMPALVETTVAAAELKVIGSGL